MTKLIYLDNAATSFPKPPPVTQAVTQYLEQSAANPGRSGHRLSAAAARIIFETREDLARLLGVSDSRQILFTPNATGALNLALLGLLRDGDHVVTTSLEHNSVMRPLRHLQEARGVTVTVVPSAGDGTLDPQRLRDALGPRTRLVAVNHASNVVGTIAPLAEIRAAIGDTPLLVDGAQTVGAIPFDVERLGIDLLAFSGHKALLGPQGVGGLYLRPGLRVAPLTWGGTGSGSESDEQPEDLPDHYESGTPNGVGIAGLGAGVRFITEWGIGNVVAHEQELLAAFLDGLQRIEGVRLYGPPGAGQRVPVVSLRVAGLSASEVSFRLDRRFGIMTRAGLHCAPEAHRSLGTFGEGTVRLSPGCMSRPEDVALAIEAVDEIAREARR